MEYRFYAIAGNIGSMYGGIGGAASREIRWFRMPFPSNRQLSRVSRRRILVPAEKRLGRLFEMEFCHEAPYISSAPPCSTFGDEKYPDRALYVLLEL